MIWRSKEYIGNSIQFNLSRASWWGGMLERMISMVKTSLYRAIGSAKLTFYQLQEVVLDVLRKLYWITSHGMPRDLS